MLGLVTAGTSSVPPGSQSGGSAPVLDNAAATPTQGQPKIMLRMTKPNGS